MIHLKNPHSVLAALACRPKDITEVRISRNALKSPQDPWGQVARQAEAHRIVVRQPQAVKTTEGRSSAQEAVLRERPPVSVEEMFTNAGERAGGKGVWLALDSLQDPQNIGAIFRSAAFFGVQGVVLTVDRSAPLSAAAYDVASGGLEYVPFCQPGNIQHAFKAAKDAGVWILGTSEHAELDLSQVTLDRPWLVVLGNEENGLRRLTQENCDQMVRISSRGRLPSLNVSVSAGILLAHLS